MDSSSSPPHSKTRFASRVGLFFLGLLLASLGAAFCWFLWNGYERSAATREWEPTPCVVISSLIEENTHQMPQDRRFYARVTYRYTFEGKEYQSQRITQRDGPSRNQDEIEDRLAQYPIGEKLTCYVNPANPDEAILKHSTRAAGYSIWFPGLFVIGGIGMMASAFLKN